MKNTATPRRARRVTAIAAAAVLAIFGIAAIVKGIDGRSTVREALQLEAIVGTPDMTPTAIAAKAKQANLAEVALPTCSVAGKPVNDGASARCFAEYMRVDALTATQGKTYAQMPRFATEDGQGTSDPKLAQQGPNGKPVNNPARQVWVTETALSTALNTSYMAEQISLFGIAVGVALLLVGLVIAAFAMGSVRMPSLAAARGRAAEQATSA